MSSDERDRYGMSCSAAMTDDLRTDPSVRKCSTSSTSSTSSSGSMLEVEERDAAAVAVAVVDDVVPAGSESIRMYAIAATAAVPVNDKAPDSDIHTDDCSSDESNGPDSPAGLKMVSSVYDFRLDGADGRLPCNNNACIIVNNNVAISNNNPFATGPDTDLTKVARKQLRMIREVDVAVCHLNHTNTIISKILSSKYLRRWENHQIRLKDDCITSNTVSEYMVIRRRQLRYKSNLTYKHYYTKKLKLLSAHFSKYFVTRCTNNIIL